VQGSPSSQAEGVPQVGVGRVVEDEVLVVVDVLGWVVVVVG
jgi:hypothetical protein